MWRPDIGTACKNLARFTWLTRIEGFAFQNTDRLRAAPLAAVGAAKRNSGRPAKSTFRLNSASGVIVEPIFGQ